MWKNFSTPLVLLCVVAYNVSMINDREKKMVVTRFGTKVKVISVDYLDYPNIWVMVKKENGDIHEYNILDLRADGGMKEILLAPNAQGEKQETRSKKQ